MLQARSGPNDLQLNELAQAKFTNGKFGSFVYNMKMAPRSFSKATLAERENSSLLQEPPRV